MRKLILVTIVLHQLFQSYGHTLPRSNGIITHYSDERTITNGHAGHQFQYTDPYYNELIEEEESFKDSEEEEIPLERDQLSSDDIKDEPNDQDVSKNEKVFKNLAVPDKQLDKIDNLLERDQLSSEVIKEELKDQDEKVIKNVAPNMKPDDQLDKINKSMENNANDEEKIREQETIDDSIKIDIRFGDITDNRTVEDIQETSLSRSKREPKNNIKHKTNDKSTGTKEHNSIFSKDTRTYGMHLTGDTGFVWNDLSPEHIEYHVGGKEPTGTSIAPELEDLYVPTPLVIPRMVDEDIHEENEEDSQLDDLDWENEQYYNETENEDDEDVGYYEEYDNIYEDEELNEAYDKIETIFEKLVDKLDGSENELTDDNEYAVKRNETEKIKVDSEIDDKIYKSNNNKENSKINQNEIKASFQEIEKVFEEITSDDNTSKSSINKPNTTSTDSSKYIKLKPKITVPEADVKPRTTLREGKPNLNHKMEYDNIYEDKEPHEAYDKIETKFENLVDKLDGSENELKDDNEYAMKRNETEKVNVDNEIDSKTYKSNNNKENSKINPKEVKASFQEIEKVFEEITSDDNTSKPSINKPNTTSTDSSKYIKLKPKIIDPEADVKPRTTLREEKPTLNHKVTTDSSKDLKLKPKIIDPEADVKPRTTLREEKPNLNHKATTDSFKDSKLNPKTTDPEADVKPRTTLREEKPNLNPEVTTDSPKDSKLNPKTTDPEADVKPRTTLREEKPNLNREVTTDSSKDSKLNPKITDPVADVKPRTTLREEKPNLNHKAKNNKDNDKKQKEFVKDLLNNKYLWNWIEKASAEYIEQFKTNVEASIQTEVGKQIEQYFEEHKDKFQNKGNETDVTIEQELNKPNMSENSNITKLVTTDIPTLSNNTEFNLTNKLNNTGNSSEEISSVNQDRPISIKAQNMFGSSQGSGQVTNIFIYNFNKSFELENIKPNDFIFGNIKPGTNKTDVDVQEVNKTSLATNDNETITDKPNLATHNASIDLIGNNNEATTEKENLETDSNNKTETSSYSEKEDVTTPKSNIDDDNDKESTANTNKSEINDETTTVKGSTEDVNNKTETSSNSEKEDVTTSKSNSDDDDDDKQSTENPNKVESNVDTTTATDSIDNVNNETETSSNSEKEDITTPKSNNNDENTTENLNESESNDETTTIKGSTEDVNNKTETSSNRETQDVTNSKSNIDNYDDKQLTENPNKSESIDETTTAKGSTEDVKELNKDDEVTDKNDDKNDITTEKEKIDEK